MMVVSRDTDMKDLALSGRNLIKLPGKEMKISPKAYVNPYALIIGEVEIEDNVTVWPGAIIRADEAKVIINEGSAILDRAFIEAPKGYDVIIGPRALVSHGAMIHGAIVGEGALVGIGAILLEGVNLGPYSIAGAGCVVKPGTVVDSGVMVAGIPATVKRTLNQTEKENIIKEVERVSKKAVEYGTYYLLKQGL